MRSPPQKPPKPRRPRHAATRKASARTASAHDVQTALAGFAHEVRTPLNGILVLAELLAASDLGERERGWAEALRSAADHLSQLTTVVVDGARADLGKLVPRREAFEAQALAGALEQSLAARASLKGLRATARGAEQLPRQLRGDAVLLRAAAENLIDNAVKFTPNGMVTLDIALEANAHGETLLSFAVADEGIGMTAAELRRLFRPFARANAKVEQHYRGAGLGLAFTRQIARAMGGDLMVKSAPGAGTTVVFSAQVERVEDDQTASEHSALAPTSGAALRILCAEDNPYGRVMFNTMATALRHRIDFVTSGEAAAKAVQGGGYDLVLMDVTLAGMDGIAATRLIRATGGAVAQVPIVGISGRGDAREQDAAREAGMDDYLVKPVSPSALAAAITRHRR